MSFPSKAPSSLPPGLKLGVFAGGGPFPRLVAPGIVVGDRDPSSHLEPHPKLRLGPGCSSSPSSSSSSSHAQQQLGLTHVLTRSESAPLAHQILLPQQQQQQQQDGSGSNTGSATAATGGAMNADSNSNVLIIGEQQTLRETVELLVRVRVACPWSRILLLGGEPFVAAAYLMAIEGRDLQASWRLVTGETLEPRVFREVHRVLSAFAKDVEEEGRRLARLEEERRKRGQESQHPLQPPRKRGRNHNEWRHGDPFLPHKSDVISHP